MKKLLICILACVMLLSVACTEASQKKIDALKEVAQEAQKIEESLSAPVIDDGNAVVPDADNDEKLNVVEEKSELVVENDKIDEPVENDKTDADIVSDKKQDSANDNKEKQNPIVDSEAEQNNGAANEAESSVVVEENEPVEEAEKVEEKDFDSKLDEIKEAPVSGDGKLDEKEDAPVSAESIKFEYKVVRDASNTYGSTSVRVIKDSTQLRNIVSGTSMKNVDSIYDDDFFASHVLFYFHVGANSGSVQFSIVSVERDGEVIKINGMSKSPDIGTCDMAGWGIFVAVSTEDYHDGDAVTSNLLNRGIDNTVNM